MDIQKYLEKIEKIDKESSVEVITDSLKFLLKELLLQSQEASEEQKKELEKLLTGLENIKQETTKLHSFLVSHRIKSSIMMANSIQTTTHLKDDVR